jgi:hypothetical protein
VSVVRTVWNALSCARGVPSMARQTCARDAPSVPRHTCAQGVPNVPKHTKMSQNLAFSFNLVA